MIEDAKPLTTANSDEIDLFDLGLKLARFFKRVFWRLLIGVGLGALLGFCFFYFAPKQYESRMLIQSEILTASLGKAMINDINMLIQEKSWDTLSLKLFIDKETAAQLISVDLKSPLERAEQLKESEKGALEVTVRTYNPTKLKQIQNGIEKYLGNNPFSKETEVIKREYYLASIKRFDDQIEELKVLQSKFLEGKLYTATKDVTFMFDPSVFSDRLLKSQIQRLKYLDSIKLNKNIRVITGFTAFQKPVYPKALKSVGIGAALGLVTILALVLLAEIKNMLDA